MSDLLDAEFVNGLPQPLLSLDYGSDVWWPVHDIDIQTGLMRIDVCGLLQIKRVGDVRTFKDADGTCHASESFYLEGGEP